LLYKPGIPNPAAAQRLAQRYRPSAHAAEIPLAERPAAVAEDGVGRGGVEVEVRQRAADQVVLAREAQRAGAGGQRDGALLLKALPPPAISR
jgi:hypothetical protein